MQLTASPKRLIALVAVIAVGAVGWYAIAPTALGGSAQYSITSGTSMEPRFHSGDLAIVRPESSYHVGEIVLYESSILHRPVLHRIIAIQHGHYYFKGDNNSFVDPGYATRSALLGKLWVRVPRLGAVLGWFGTPIHAALVVAFVCVLLLGGFTGRRRSRRRSVSALPNRLTAAAATAHGERMLAGAIAVLVVGLLMCVVGFATPTQKSTTLANAYTQDGSFSYGAATIRPSAAYPGDRADTGDPLYLKLFRDVDVRFAYALKSTLPHAVRGTIGLRVEISNASGWQRSYVLRKPHAFSGDRASVAVVIKLAQLESLITELGTDSGDVGDSYAVDLIPTVRVHGAVGSVVVDEVFSPTLPFTVTSSTIKLNASAPVLAPGATYSPPTQAQEAAAALHPSEPGSIPDKDTNTLSFMRFALGVWVVRILGLVLLGAGLAVLRVGRKLLESRESISAEMRLLTKYRCLPVPVVGLSTQGASEVREFESLARLAHYKERPVLVDVEDDVSVYGVEDGERLYVYRAIRGDQDLPAAEPVRRPMPLSRRRRHRRLALPLVLLVAVSIGLAASFTASTTVPASNAGTSHVTEAVSQLEPSGCSSLSVTTLVRASGTYTNSLSHVLIVGTANADTITDHGIDNCIVGGGGADHVTGGAGDYCQAGPNLSSKYTGCTKF